MSLTKKLIFLFLLISLVPIAIISTFVYFTTRERITQQVIGQLELIALIQENRINSAVDQNLERLSAVSERPQLKEILTQAEPEKLESSDAIKSVLYDAVSSIKSFHDIFILDLDGKVIASTNEDVMGRQYNDAEFYLKGKEVNNVESFFLDENRRVRVYLSGPIKKDNENLVGIVVVIESEVENILSLIKDYSGLGRTGEILLARRDKNGNALFITPSRFQANAALRTIVSKRNQKEPITQALLKKEILLTDAVDYRDKPVLAATRYIDKTDWGLVVKIDKEEAFAPIGQLRNYFLYTTIITSVFAILNAWYFAKKITYPIIILTKLASKLSSGDLSQKVDIHSNDEIGHLASSFNQMAAKLKKSYESLEQRVLEKTAELGRKIKEIQQQIAKDEALLDSIGDGVIAIDEKQRIILINRAALLTLGLKAEDLIGEVLKDVIKIVDAKGNLLPHSKNIIELAFSSEAKFTTTPSDSFYFTRRDKTTFPVFITATPIILSGRAIGTILVFRDITHEREIDKMRTEFISLASHQLRTPLSAVKWYANMLLGEDAGKLKKEQLEFIENINLSNDRMIDLVNSLLNISRIESGRIIIDPKPTDLEVVVKGLISEFREKLEEKKLETTVEIQHDLPKINIDPNLIREVYINLLTNSINYTPEGGKISVAVGKEGKLIVSQITDNGYGIPTKEQHRVFQKFYRGENVIPRETGGTGLGLYLSKSIIESSGGNIWFESIEGKGTTFSFSLPIRGAASQKGEVSLIPTKVKLGDKAPGVSSIKYE